jgi:hypothetical protein
MHSYCTKCHLLLHWRLQVCPTIQELVIQIEGCLRSILPEDQGGVYPLDEVNVPPLVLPRLLLVVTSCSCC